MIARVVRFAVDWVRALLSVIVLLTVGLTSARLRGYLRRIVQEVGVLPTRPSPIRVRSVDSQGALDAPLILPDLVAADGNVSLLELSALARIVRARAPRVLWEIGTFDGRTTRVLAANAPPGAEIHTLDLPAHTTAAHTLSGAERVFVEKDAPGARYRGTPEEQRITGHLSDSATFDFAPWTGRTEFVFVDGSHAEAYVRNDTARAFSLTQGRSAVIVWHDYEAWPDVTRVLDELAQGEPGLFRIEGTSLVVLERSPR